MSSIHKLSYARHFNLIKINILNNWLNSCDINKIELEKKCMTYTHIKRRFDNFLFKKVLNKIRKDKENFQKERKFSNKRKLLSEIWKSQTSSQKEWELHLNLSVKFGKSKDNMVLLFSKIHTFLKCL